MWEGWESKRGEIQVMPLACWGSHFTGSQQVLLVMGELSHCCQCWFFIYLNFFFFYFFFFKSDFGPKLDENIDSAMLRVV